MRVKIIARAWCDSLSATWLVPDHAHTRSGFHNMLINCMLVWDHKTFPWVSVSQILLLAKSWVCLVIQKIRWSLLRSLTGNQHEFRSPFLQQPYNTLKSEASTIHRNFAILPCFVHGTEKLCAFSKSTKCKTKVSTAAHSNTDLSGRGEWEGVCLFGKQSGHWGLDGPRPRESHPITNKSDQGTTVCKTERPASVLLVESLGYLSNLRGYFRSRRNVRSF